MHFMQLSGSLEHNPSSVSRLLHQAQMPSKSAHESTIKQVRELAVQNSKAKQNNTSKAPPKWLWFKRNPNNPYKVSEPACGTL